jgi:hypothetical protein
MKRNLTIVLSSFFALFLLHSTVHAQVAIKLEIQHSNFIKYEPVLLRITLRNYSGHTLIFGKNSKLKGKLEFKVIENFNNLITPKNSLVMPSLEGTIIMPTKTKTILVNLGKYYGITKVGKYRVQAIISHSQFDKKYISNLVGFNVEKGLVVWERIVGVLDVNNKNPDKIKSRKYKIVQYNDGQHSIYSLVVEDKNFVYSIRPIGYRLENALPQCVIDNLNRVHILLKQGPKLYKYFCFDLKGKLVKKQDYLKNSSTPYLAQNKKTEEIYIVGGRKLTEKEKRIDNNDALPFNQQLPGIKK